ncbi:fungal-specific transcription factor domain-containing protein [Phyllosticta citrichinensis]|uniref:Fungal-specific transcription factor domain-containing protein n=1 Tax=Phyllosticta citrichinensis TaxID=1130410 RepID=A0ABR1XVG4_9PEZI
MPPSCNPQQRTDVEDELKARNRIAHACASCHARKIKCDLTARRGPPCSRCEDSELPCNVMIRRRRMIRAVESVSREVVDAAAAAAFGNHPHGGHQTSVETPNTVSIVSSSSETTKKATTTTTTTGELFSSLGPSDRPRRFEVSGLHDISKQKSILLEFLSQNFHEADISDYQPTFVDEYASVTRLLGREFGRGFAAGVYHFRDAPGIPRTITSGIPRTITSTERQVLDHHGAFMLPSAPIADAFITAFFDRVFPTMPIMDRGTFLKNYYGVGGAASARKLSLLLIQAVMLAGSVVYNHPDVQLLPDEVSSRLHARARALINTNFEQDRLVLVQAHLLIGSFTGDSCDDTINNMWLSLGTAVRIAQGIGLHRDLGRAKASLAMRRQWKRIFWTLFIHDTICSFEWGRPRAIHLADTDVPLPSEADFSPDDPGGLPSTEHIQFFLSLCRLCFLIVEWMELLRPGRMAWGHGSSASEPYVDQTASVRLELETWLAELPPAMQAPADGASGFALWPGTLHIAYYAVVLRLYASLTGAAAADKVHTAAERILDIGKDLAAQNLLESLWGFGLHQLDLAVGQHARETKSAEQGVAESALGRLREGVLLLREVCQRSSTAAQGLAFYEALLEGRNTGHEGEAAGEVDEAREESTGPMASGLQQPDSRLAGSWGAARWSGDDLASLGFLDWNAQWT